MRTEFLFIGRARLPDEDEQSAPIGALARMGRGKPVIIRTLDVGGDKPMPGLTLDGETNPFLGLRGLRLSLARPELFRPQVRALLRAAVARQLKVMLPMVTVPDEFAAARGALRRLRSRSSGARRACGRVPPLGIMVEVPAAGARRST